MGLRVSVSVSGPRSGSEIKSGPSKGVHPSTVEIAVAATAVWRSLLEGTALLILAWSNSQ